MVKNLPTSAGDIRDMGLGKKKKKKETWVRSLGLEDPQEEGVANHASILAWRISWREEPSRL